MDTLTSFSELQLREQRYGNGERLLREALNTLGKNRPGDWRRYNAESLLGAALSGQQRYADAEPLLLSGYAGLTQRKDTIPSTEKSRMAETGEWIVQLYRTWGQPEKANAWQARLAKESGDAVQTAVK
jgi:hypothetical protein